MIQGPYLVNRNFQIVPREKNLRKLFYPVEKYLYSHNFFRWLFINNFEKCFPYYLVFLRVTQIYVTLFSL